MKLRKTLDVFSQTEVKEVKNLNNKTRNSTDKLKIKDREPLVDYVRANIKDKMLSLVKLIDSI